MGKKLIVDLPKMEQQDISQIRCSYKYHPGNNGIKTLLEKIHFALICRKCYSAPCVTACPRQALEKVDTNGSEDKILKRADMRCTGCGTCAMACPFGTIYTDLILFTDDVCDLCRGRLKENEKPLCVRTCTDGCLDYRDVEAKGDYVEVFEDVVVSVPAGTLWEPFL